MNSNLGDFLTVCIIAVSIVSFFISKQIIQYKLKKEQIKADAMVRVEETNARNRLEIEKLYLKDQSKSNETNNDMSTANESDDNRSVREKIKS